jgi:uncharacterized protein (PEP-CTERM system associated)
MGYPASLARLSGLGLIALGSFGCGHAFAQAYGGTAPLSPTGTDVRVGDLRRVLQPLFEVTAPPATEPAWIVSGGLDVQEIYSTGNSGNASPFGTSGFITSITPSLLVNGDTSRLKVNLNYAPTGYIYASSSGQDYVTQNFNGSALATLIPETLFLDVRGFASTQSSTGAVGPTGTVVLNRENQTQFYAFSASPYLQHRFGDLGTGEIGYTIAKSIQTGNTNTFFINQSGQLQAISNQNLLTQSQHVSFTTGEALGRIQNTLLGTTTEYNGSGVLQDAHNYTVVNDLGYAITRTITLLGRAGYEDIHYSGIPQTNINDMVWGVGVRLTPNADSSITVRYGRQDGVTAAFVDASIAPTARTRIFARYSEGLTTDQQDIQNSLQTSVTDPLGTPVSPQTGVPILPFNNFFGTQNDALYILKRYSITAVLLLDRDTFTADVTGEDRKLVATSLAGAAVNGPSNGVYGSLSWSRDLTPVLRSNVYFQYGSNSQSTLFSGQTLQTPNSVPQQLLVASTSLTYDLSETLTATAQYSFNETMSDLPGASGTNHLIVIGISKRF